MHNINYIRENPVQFDNFMKTRAAMWFTILGITIVLIFGVIYFITK